jgi:hypothetical protein
MYPKSFTKEDCHTGNTAKMFHFYSAEEFCRNVAIQSADPCIQRKNSRSTLANGDFTELIKIKNT